ncbi:MAG: hypothetical protein AB7P12_07975 [Alphaproteobacteria bacterium]
MSPIYDEAKDERPTHLDEALAGLSDSELAELIACALAEAERRQPRPH